MTMTGYRTRSTPVYNQPKPMNPPSLPVAGESRPSVSAGLTGVFNVFIDPAATAKAVRAPLAWLWPLLIAGIVRIIFGWLSVPIMIDILSKNPPNGLSGEQLERAITISNTMYRVGAVASPLLIAGWTALVAALIMLVYSVVGVRAKFRDIFSLVSACALISMIHSIAAFFVIQAKAGELQSFQQLSPPFGLDILFSDLKGPLYAILNFFSIFEIWYLVILIFGLSYLTGSSRGKAFIAATPSWLLGLLGAIIG